MDVPKKNHFPTDSLAETPILESTRLILRPLSTEDAATIFNGWAKDPKSTQYMSWDTHLSIDETIAWLRSEESAIHTPQSFNFGITLKETGELIGTGGILYDEYSDRFQLGYILASRHRNKGYATEASHRILDYAIGKLKIEQFVAFHAVDNPASGRVLEKLGFTYHEENLLVGSNGSKTLSCRKFFLDVD